jgi:hypothetical protein
MKNTLRVRKNSPLQIPKKRGEWAELQFMARSSQQGLIVSKPWGESAKYDFIVDSCGIVRRVQVKSTYCVKNKSRAYTCNIVCGFNRQGRYNPGEIDFFALLVIPEDAWYIIPFEELRRARSAVFLNPRDPRNLYAPYLEAWHLLRRPPVR